uniref:Alkaline phosphatase n=1 Tax=Lygus hesperus TaxID=30085 RepID=A0A0A9YX71_LYGHE
MRILESSSNPMWYNTDICILQPVKISHVFLVLSFWMCLVQNLPVYNHQTEKRTWRTYSRYLGDDWKVYTRGCGGGPKPKKQKSVDSKHLHGTPKYLSIEEKAPYWKDMEKEALLKMLLRKPNFNKAKNVIFFLGDGMSLTTISTSRIYKGQLNGGSGEEGSLFFEDFPNTGLVKTFCVDSQVADSACSATAYWTGVKGNIKTIGVTAAVKREGNCSSITEETSPTSLLNWAQDAGKSTGVVTTTTVTHASPAGGYAHILNRNMESDAEVIKLNRDPKECTDIAQQLIYNVPGKNLNVIMGGGRANFYPVDAQNESGTKGKRKDGKNLIDAWVDNKKLDGKRSYVWNREQLLNADLNNTDYLMGLFSNEHLQFYQLADKKVQPSLAEMTEAAVKVYKRIPKASYSS